MNPDPKYVALYTDFLKNASKITKPISVICDASNGSTGPILEKLLPELNLKSFTVINSEPNPEFPAHGPNPLLPGVLDQICKKVVETKSDFGVAFDADGDRAFYIDEKGRVVPSYILAAFLFKGEKAPFVADELVYQALRMTKLFTDSELFPAKVGVYFIKQKMQEVGASTAVEFSCHLYFKDFFGADSGIFSLVRVASILSNSDMTLGEFIDQMPKHFVKNTDLQIVGKDWKAIFEKLIEEYKKLGALVETREGVSIVFENKWANVRPSNTEPLLRIYVGAQDEKDCEKLIDEIKAKV